MSAFVPAAAAIGPPPGSPPLPTPTRVELPGRGTTDVLEYEGPPDAPTLVLLHGWTSTAAVNWFNVLAPAAERYRVVAPDLRSHGRGPRGRGRATLAQCADDVAALVTALDIHRPIIAGYSLGGVLAQLAWKRHRRAVGGLVLCASATHFDVNVREHARFLGLEVSWRLARPVPDRISRDVALMIFDRLYGSEGFQRWVNRVVSTHHWPDVLALGAELGHFDSRPWVGEVDVPAASVVTVGDTYVPPPRQLELALATGASVHYVAGDHSVCLSDRDRFLEPFLQACHDVESRMGDAEQSEGDAPYAACA